MLEKLEEIGKRINTALDNKNINNIQICKDELLEMNQEELSPDEKAVYFYFLGNAWSAIDDLKCKKDINLAWSYQRNELNNAIINYRKVLIVPGISKNTIKYIFIQNYTNLGNMFSNAGRTISAIAYWKKSLKINSDFGMALLNLGYGYLYYSGLLYDYSHRDFIVKAAYQQFQISYNNPYVYPFLKDSIKSIIEDIQKRYKKEFLDVTIGYEEKYFGTTRTEIKYKKWVMENVLFLNPLNDTYQLPIVCHDILGLPDHTVSIKENPAPIFIGFFNQIKQEFISLRYLFYQSTLMENENHFSDKGNHLLNTLDYTEYGLKTEYLKISFRMAYSVFDKIAYFLNKYLQLGLKERDVSFKSIWYSNYKRKILNQTIIDLKNFPLRGLYFLNKDFYEEGDYQESIEPEAKELKDIRNYIEHKYIKLHNEFWDGKTQHTGNITLDSRIDNWAYNLYEKDFSQKTLKIIKLCREAIIYLSLAVHFEEKKKKPEGFIPKLPLPEM